MKFSVNSIPQAFTSKYSLDVNQPVGDEKACFRRDVAIGAFSSLAKNGPEITQKLDTFFKTEYNKNPKAPFVIEMDLNNKDDKNFEDTMNSVGQKFSKIA